MKAENVHGYGTRSCMVMAQDRPLETISSNLPDLKVKKFVFLDPAPVFGTVYRQNYVKSIKVGLKRN